jgi:hypothetical protein
MLPKHLPRCKIWISYLMLCCWRFPIGQYSREPYLNHTEQNSPHPTKDILKKFWMTIKALYKSKLRKWYHFSLWSFMFKLKSNINDWLSFVSQYQVSFKITNVFQSDSTFITQFQTFNWPWRNFTFPVQFILK